MHLLKAKRPLVIPRVENTANIYPGYNLRADQGRTVGAKAYSKHLVSWGEHQRGSEST